MYFVYILEYICVSFLDLYILEYCFIILIFLSIIKYKIANKNIRALVYYTILLYYNLIMILSCTLRILGLHLGQRTFTPCLSHKAYHGSNICVS